MQKHPVLSDAGRDVFFAVSSEFSGSVSAAAEACFSQPAVACEQIVYPVHLGTVIEAFYLAVEPLIPLFVERAETVAGAGDAADSGCGAIVVMSHCHSVREAFAYVFTAEMQCKDYQARVVEGVYVAHAGITLIGEAHGILPVVYVEALGKRPAYAFGKPAFRRDLKQGGLKRLEGVTQRKCGTDGCRKEHGAVYAVAAVGKVCVRISQPRGKPRVAGSHVGIAVAAYIRADPFLIGVVFFSRMIGRYACLKVAQRSILGGICQSHVFQPCCRHTVECEIKTSVFA